MRKNLLEYLRQFGRSNICVVVSGDIEEEEVPENKIKRQSSVLV